MLLAVTGTALLTELAGSRQLARRAWPSLSSAHWRRRRCRSSSWASRRRAMSSSNSSSSSSSSVTTVISLLPPPPPWPPGWSSSSSSSSLFMMAVAAVVSWPVAFASKADILQAAFTLQLQSNTWLATLGCLIRRYFANWSPRFARA